MIPLTLSGFSFILSIKIQAEYKYAVIGYRITKAESQIEPISKAQADENTTAVYTIGLLKNTPATGCNRVADFQTTVEEGTPATIDVLSYKKDNLNKPAI